MLVGTSGNFSCGYKIWVQYKSLHASVWLGLKRDFCSLYDALDSFAFFEAVIVVQSGEDAEQFLVRRAQHKFRDATVGDFIRSVLRTRLSYNDMSTYEHLHTSIC